MNSRRAGTHFGSHSLAAKAVLVAFLLISAGCTPAEPVVVTATPSPVPTAVPTPQVDVEGVHFAAEDDIELYGRLFTSDLSTGSNLGLVLAHMGDPDLVSGVTNQTGWESFARAAAARGYTTLTFDFRCHGLSACGPEGRGEHYLLRDMRAALALLQDRGFERIVCMGASMGGTACGNVAMETELAGLVIIASTTPREHSFPDDLVNPHIPKLFVVADNDYGAVVVNTNQMYGYSPEPKQLATYASDAHGTNLFYTEYGTEFHELLMDFLDGLP